MPPGIIVLITFLLVISISYLDYITGPTYSFSIFYLLPLTFATWNAGRKIGIFLSFVCAAAWWIVDIYSSNVFYAEAAPFWNAIVRLGFFLIIAFLFSEVKGLLIQKDEMLAQIQEKMEHALNFSSLASHELKTPLSIIKLQLEEGLQTNTAVNESTKLLSSIYDEVLRITNIVNDLLRLATLESGTLVLQKEPCELNTYLKEFCDDIEILCRAKGLNFEYFPCERIFVNIDEKYFREVFLNLVDNAIKFSPSNGTISLSCIKDTGSVIISLRDSGEGIPPEQLQNIFLPFSTDLSKSKPHSGTGLGLNISKKIIELHGGSILAKSKPTEGAQFDITLPIP